MSDLSRKQKKELAKTLFLGGNLTQKDIAAKVDISEKSLSKWVNDEEWEKQRKSLLTTRQHVISFLHDQLDRIKTVVDTNKAMVNSKEADSILKITAAIKNLETEIGLGEVIGVAQQFISFVQAFDLDLAKNITAQFDLFIKDKTKKTWH